MCNKVTIKDPTAFKARLYTTLWNIGFEKFSETLCFKRHPLLFCSLFQQIIGRYLTNVNAKIAQSLLIANVIICNQSVRFFLEHKPELACATVWWQNQWRTVGGDCTIQQCALTTLTSRMLIYILYVHGVLHAFILHILQSIGLSSDCWGTIRSQWDEVWSFLC